MTMEELRAVQLGLLRRVKAVCAREGLRYTLFGGTLIGAARHQGYIPWDDDIDVALPRPDYEALIKHLAREPGVTVLCHTLRPDYYYPYAKLCDARTLLIEVGMPPIAGLGVNIDLLPIDSFSKSAIARKLQLYRLFFYKKGWVYAVAPGDLDSPSPLKRAAKRAVKPALVRLCRWKGTTFWRDLVVQAMAGMPYEKGTLAGYPFGGGMHSLMPRAVFERYAELPFEGEAFSVVADYDACLTQIFGDWRTPPPEKDRVAPHAFTAMWREDAP